MKPAYIPYAILVVFLVFLVGLHLEISEQEQEIEALRADVENWETMVERNMVALRARIAGLEHQHDNLELQRTQLLGLVALEPEPDSPNPTIDDQLETELERIQEHEPLIWEKGK